MARNSRKRAAGNHDNNAYKYPRLDGGRADHYHPRNLTPRRRSATPPRHHPAQSRTNPLPQPARRDSSPDRRYPLRSIVPRAIKRDEDSALALRETSMTSDRRHSITQPTRRIQEEGPETMLEITTWDAVWETGMLSLEQQLPQMREDESHPLDLFSPPQLLSTIQPSTHSWRTAFVAGIFVYVDATNFQRLIGLNNVDPCQLLRQSELTQIHDMVVCRSGDHHQLVDHKDLDSGNPRRPQWPSINTLSREAFNWYIGPHLTLGEKQMLDAFWAGLPRFNEDMPNTVPGHPELRATPKQLPNGDWDWTEMLQPIRWFMCPCALMKHQCEFTGERLMRCQGWQGVCCSRICRHGPNTTLIHVGTVCSYKWKGNPCPQDRECMFVHGVAVTAKGIEHRRYHHRVREL